MTLQAKEAASEEKVDAIMKEVRGAGVKSTASGMLAITHAIMKELCVVKRNHEGGVWGRGQWGQVHFHREPSLRLCRGNII